MNVNYKQSQFELFPGSPGSSAETQKPRYMFTSLTFSLENLVVTGIIGLIVLVFVFSIGVERGKRVAINKPQKEELIQTTSEKRLEKPQSPQLISVEKPAEIAKMGTAEEAPLPAQIEDAAKEQGLDGKYTIQVASFKKGPRAEVEAKNLRQKGYDILVLPKGEYSIVCVGKFSDRSEAKSFSKKLKHQYKDFLIRRL